MSLADEIAGQIRSHFPAQMIILFGSRARGDAAPDSDWDFLVVMPSDQRSAKRALAVRRVVRPWPAARGVPMDILVRTPEEMARGFPLSKEILLAGKVLYRAPSVP